MDETSTGVIYKQDLLDHVEESWTSLQLTIESCTPEQLAGPRDAGGWAAKDHIAHLAAWENSMVYLLRGQPRHEGLGVSESTYLAGNEDQINDEIYRKTRDLDLPGTLARHAMIHKDMLALLANLSDIELERTYSHFLPDEPGTDDGSPIIDRIYGNTAHHYTMHCTYIERLIAG